MVPQKLDALLVRRLTGDAEFARYDAHLLHSAIRSMSHTVWCPKVECQHPAQVTKQQTVCQFLLSNSLISISPGL